MNWEAIGAIGEVVGAAGVIASLLYLAIQLRANARASAVESKLRSASFLNDFIDSLIQNPELNDLFLRGIADINSLTEEEYFRFSNMSLKAFWFFSAGHFQFRTGALNDDEFHETRAVLRYWLRGKGCRAWWEKLGRGSVSPAFREFVDAEIREVNAA